MKETIRNHTDYFVTLANDGQVDHAQAWAASNAIRHLDSYLVGLLALPWRDGAYVNGVLDNFTTTSRTSVTRLGSYLM